jgi:hypothetical protein
VVLVETNQKKQCYKGDYIYYIVGGRDLNVVCVSSLKV